MNWGENGWSANVVEAVFIDTEQKVRLWQRENPHLISAFRYDEPLISSMFLKWKVCSHPEL